MATVWERRFPPLGQGSTSVVVPNPTPTQRATTPSTGGAIRRGKSPPRSESAALGGEKEGALVVKDPTQGTLDILRGRVRPPHRKMTPVPTTGKGKGKGSVRPQTPHEALKSAVEAQRTVLDYSSVGIKPGGGRVSPARPDSPRSPGGSRRRQRTVSPTTGMPQTAGPGTAGVAAGRHGDRDHHDVHRIHGDALSFAQDPFQEFENATGFEMMEASLQRVHTRLLDTPLERRWRSMASWLDRYFIDRDTEEFLKACREVHHSVSLRLSPENSLSVSLSQQKSFRLGDGGGGGGLGDSGGLGSPRSPKTGLQKSESFAGLALGQDGVRMMPSGVKVATSMMLMEQALHLLARYCPTLKSMVFTLRDDLLQAIYYNYPDQEINESFETLHTSDDIDLQQRLITRYYNKTYFQQLRDERKKANRTVEDFEKGTEVKSNQMKVMTRAVTHWQRYSMDRVFMGWRRAVQEWKAERLAQSKQQELHATIGSKEEELKSKDEQIAALTKSNEEAAFKHKKEVRSLKARLEDALKEVNKVEAKYQRAKEMLLLQQGGGENSSPEGSPKFSSPTLSDDVGNSVPSSRFARSGSDSGVDPFAKLHTDLVNAQDLIYKLQQENAALKENLTKSEASDDKHSAMLRKVKAMLPVPSLRIDGIEVTELQGGFGEQDPHRLKELHAGLLSWAEQTVSHHHSLPPDFFRESTSAIQNVRRHLIVYGALFDIPFRTSAGEIVPIAEIHASAGSDSEDSVRVKDSEIADELFKKFLKTAELRDIFTSAVDLAKSFGASGHGDPRRASLSPGTVSLETLVQTNVAEETAQAQRRKHMLTLLLLHHYCHVLLPDTVLATWNPFSAVVELDDLVPHYERTLRLRRTVEMLALRLFSL